MWRRRRDSLSLLLLLVCGSIVASCTSMSGDVSTGRVGSETPDSTVVRATSTPLPPTATATPSPSPSPSRTPDPTPSVIGPGYIVGYNPLTGLPVQNRGSLLRVPLLISITEFPPSARPQSGLSFADQVWETSIGQGMSRFLAVYYGDYMDHFSRLVAGDSDLDQDSTVIGPVRSGRLGYEQIKDFYPGALLFIRSASPEVAQELTDMIIVYADDTQDVNSAALSLSELRALDVPDAVPSAYAGLVFNRRPPTRGKPAPSVSIIYNLFDQIEWTYDPAQGFYLRSQDKADGTGALQPSIDRLTGSRLSAENVVVMFAQHTFENRGATIVGIELAYVPKRYGILFRDGKVYDIHWASPRSKLTFTDDAGKVIAFKPGTTFFEVVSYESTWDSNKRIVRFHNPPLPTIPPPPPFLTSVPSATPTPGEAGPAEPTPG